MKCNATLLRLVLAGALAATLTACERNAVEGTAANPASIPSVSIMTFNVENLFDNADDPGKNDVTYFALADKQSDEHIAMCNEIDVDRAISASTGTGRMMLSSANSSLLPASFCRSTKVEVPISSHCRKSRTSASWSGCATNTSPMRVTMKRS